ncbi:MAG: hypothetical protein JSV83_18210 [Desulfobacterales bacterium]|nr:MAG: hypothetical protein JSV83_18210 [Desulfobacterales bacterium]
MAEIISIDEKLDLSREKKEALIRKRKILAVQKVFQCTHCAFKCEKCGTQIEHAPEQTNQLSRDLRVPYNFCEACKEEYIDYIERLKGGGDPDCYWHNEAWIDAWRRWIDYQSSVDCYLKSKEFNELLQEFKQTRPEK